MQAILKLNDYINSLSTQIIDLLKSSKKSMGKDTDTRFDVLWFVYILVAILRYTKSLGEVDTLLPKHRDKNRLFAGASIQAEEV